MEENDQDTASARPTTIDPLTTHSLLARHLDRLLDHSGLRVVRTLLLAVVVRLLRPQRVEPSPRSTILLPPPPPPLPSRPTCLPFRPTLNSPSCPRRGLAVVDLPTLLPRSRSRGRKARRPRCLCARFLGVASGSRGVNISSDMLEVSTPMRSVSSLSLSLSVLSGRLLEQ